MLCTLAMVGSAGCSSTKNGPGDPPVDASATLDAAASLDAAALDASPSDSAIAPAFDWGVSDAGMRTDCIGDLSTVGLGDFTLAFKITTSATVLSQVIAQREACTYGRFWSIRMQHTGGVTFEIGDGEGPYVVAETTLAVNDGAEHLVKIYRADNLIRIDIDGERSPLLYYRTDDYMRNEALIPSEAPHEVDGEIRLGPDLPTLDWMNSLVCTADGTQPLVGTVVPYCITPGEVLL